MNLRTLSRSLVTDLVFAVPHKAAKLVWLPCTSMRSLYIVMAFQTGEFLEESSFYVF